MTALASRAISRATGDVKAVLPLLIRLLSSVRVQLLSVWIELAQVVKEHLGLWKRRQRRPYLRIRVQIAQQPIPKTAPGECTQALFDRLEDLSRLLRLPGREQDGEERGKPPDRLREIHSLQDLLPAVPFQIHQEHALAAPARKSQQQRGQQDIIDLGMIHPRNLLEQCPGLLCVKGNTQGAAVRDGIRPARLIYRQRPDVVPGRIEPAGQFLPEKR